MTEKDLKFLDFILPILRDKYPDYVSDSDLNLMYKKQKGIDFGYRELPIFVSKYEYEYFDKVSKMNHLRIISEWIEIIDEYKSLSKYLEHEKNMLSEIDNENKQINALNKKVNELSIVNLELDIKLKKWGLFKIYWWISAGILSFIIQIIIEIATSRELVIPLIRRLLDLI